MFTAVTVGHADVSACRVVLHNLCEIGHQPSDYRGTRPCIKRYCRVAFRYPLRYRELDCPRRGIAHVTLNSGGSLIDRTSKQC